MKFSDFLTILTPLSIIAGIFFGGLIILFFSDIKEVVKRIFKKSGKMKSFVVIILDAFFCLPSMAQKNKRQQIPNLDYSVKFEFEKGKDLNFYGEYMTPLKGTSYSDNVYPTTEKEFIFKDESFHVINPSTNQVERVGGNHPYKLIKLWSGSPDNLFYALEPHASATFHTGKEKRTNVIEYLKIDYNVEKVFMWNQWWYVTYITRDKYKEYMGINIDRRFLYMFIPEAKCQIIISDSGKITLIAPEEIYVMKEKSLITQADILFNN